MAFVNVHTGIVTSPKHAPLSDGALRLWLHGLCWSKEHLTDGFIPSGMVPTLHRHAAKYVPELLRVMVPGKQPLWTKDDDGYHIHDFDDWQETSEVVQERRQKWRRQKRGQRVESASESAPVSTVDTRADTAKNPRGVRYPSEVDPIRKPLEVEGEGVDTPPAGHRLVPLQGRRKLHCAHESGIGLDVPNDLHRELLARLENAGLDDADRVLRRWYHDTEMAWHGQPIGDSTFKFWRARFAEWQGTTVAQVADAKPSVADHNARMFAALKAGHHG